LTIESAKCGVDHPCHAHSFGGSFLELAPYERIRHTDTFDDPDLPGEMQTTISLGQASCGTDRRAGACARSHPGRGRWTSTAVKSRGPTGATSVNRVAVPEEYLAAIPADLPLKVEVGAIEDPPNDVQMRHHVFEEIAQRRPTEIPIEPGDQRMQHEDIVR
jgi:hypothetical protein